MSNGSPKKGILALTAGLGAGAGLMYLFDPSRGRVRRGRLVAEASGLFHRDEDKLRKRGKYLLNRIRGAAAEAVAALDPYAHVSDEVLVERVRSRMGHVIPNPKDIEVQVSDGAVRLEGKLTHAERKRLRREVEAIPGVRCVHDDLKHRLAFGPGLLVGVAAGLGLFGRR